MFCLILRLVNAFSCFKSSQVFTYYTFLSSNIGILSKPQLGKLKSFTYPNQTKNQLISRSMLLAAWNFKRTFCKISVAELWSNYFKVIDYLLVRNWRRNLLLFILNLANRSFRDLILCYCIFLLVKN